MKLMALSSAAAFDAVAASYDQDFSNSLVGRAQRNLVWEELDKTFCAGQCVLEINCGTGEDAIHLAKGGVHVVALDGSQAMVALAERRAEAQGLRHRVFLDAIPNEELGRLGDEAVFEGLLSNFSGLNCVEDLGAVAAQLGRLLKPHAVAMVCVFGRLCAWEIAWYLCHANPEKSFRRMRRVVESRVAQDSAVNVHYHSVRSVRRAFEPYFALEGLRGIGVAVPPSYMEGVARRFPGILVAAARVDRALAGFPIWRSLGDHQLLIFRRRGK